MSAIESKVALLGRQPSGVSLIVNVDDTAALIAIETAQLSTGTIAKLADGSEYYFNANVSSGGLTPTSGGGQWIGINGATVLNVKAFGAKGDGTTNDSAAIQAAINAASQSGGGVFLPPGVYIAYQLEMRTGVWLVSNGATIKCPANATAYQNCIRFNGVNNCGILGRLYLDGNYANQTALGNMGVIAVNITNGSHDIFIESVYATGWQCDGLYIGHDSVPPYRIAIKDYTCVACGRNGTSITGAKDVHFNRLVSQGILDSDGTGPACGLDIETNIYTATLENITFDYFEARDCVGSGAQILLRQNAGIITQGGICFKRLVSIGSTTRSGLVLTTCKDVKILSGLFASNFNNGIEVSKNVTDLRIEAICELNRFHGFFASLTSQDLQSQNWNLNGSTFRNNSTSSAGTYFGAMLTTDSASFLLQNVLMLDILAYDDLASHKQGYGVVLQANTRNCQVRGRFFGNTIASFLDAVGNNFICTKRVRTTVTVNPGLIAANSSVNIFATVPAGFCTAGDHVTICPLTSPLEDGLSYVAWAAGSTTVIIRLINSTTGGITPASRNYSIVSESFQ